MQNANFTCSQLFHNGLLLKKHYHCLLKCDIIIQIAVVKAHSKRWGVHWRVIKIQTIGYHETTKREREKILSEQRFVDSRKTMSGWQQVCIFFISQTC